MWALSKEHSFGPTYREATIAHHKFLMGCESIVELINCIGVDEFLDDEGENNDSEKDEIQVTGSYPRVLDSIAKMSATVLWITSLQKRMIAQGRRLDLETIPGRQRCFCWCDGNYAESNVVYDKGQKS